MLIKKTGASACNLMVGNVNWLIRTFSSVRVMLIGLLSNIYLTVIWKFFKAAQKSAKKLVVVLFFKIKFLNETRKKNTD